TISAAWLVAGWMGWDRVLLALALPALLVGGLATSYTGFLFAQGLGRDLWQGPHAALDLMRQSGAAGAATLLLIAAASRGDDASVYVLGGILWLSALAHLTVLVFENV